MGKQVRLFFVLLFFAASSHAAKTAILIGCNAGGNTVRPLKYAERDAEKFGRLLVDVGGFDRKSVTLVLDPDSMALEKHLDKARKNLRNSASFKDDMVLLYYSGHADGTDLLLGQTRYPLRKIRSFLDSVPSGVRIGIFDACQSGSVTAYKGGKRAEPFYLRNPQKTKGQIIIASTSALERAQESESLKGSIFSFFWFAGLRGSADMSGDRRVTLGEAYAYAYRKTLETSTLTGGEAQHPTYRFNLSGEGDIVLTDLGERASGIAFDRTCTGKFLVLSESYTDIYADFFKKPGTENFVSLEPGSYTVINANDGVVGVFGFSLGNRSEVSLAQSMLVPNTFTESRIKGANPVVEMKIQTPETSPLSRWKYGLSFGPGTGLRQTADTASFSAYVTLAFQTLFYLSERSALFTGMYYYSGGFNAGADIGLDWTPRSDSGFFCGAGAALRYDRTGSDVFEKGAVPGLVAHAGYRMRIGRRLFLDMTIPYNLHIGTRIAHVIGFKAGLLWSGKYSDIKVLHY